MRGCYITCGAACYPTDNNRFLLVRNNDDVSSYVELYLVYISVRWDTKNIIQQFGSAHKLDPIFGSLSWIVFSRNCSVEDGETWGHQAGLWAWSPHKYPAVTILSQALLYLSMAQRNSSEILDLWAANISNGFQSRNNFTAPIDSVLWCIRPRNGWEAQRCNGNHQI